MNSRKRPLQNLEQTSEPKQKLQKPNPSTQQPPGSSGQLDTNKPTPLQIFLYQQFLKTHYPELLVPKIAPLPNVPQQVKTQSIPEVITQTPVVQYESEKEKQVDDNPDLHQPPFHKNETMKKMPSAKQVSTRSLGIGPPEKPVYCTKKLKVKLMYGKKKIVYLMEKQKIEVKLDSIHLFHVTHEKPGTTTLQMQLLEPPEFFEKHEDAGKWIKVADFTGANEYNRHVIEFQDNDKLETALETLYDCYPELGKLAECVPKWNDSCKFSKEEMERIEGKKLKKGKPKANAVKKKVSKKKK